MKRHTEDNLDALYMAWQEDRLSTTPTPLQDWLARYPNHASEIVRWTQHEPLVAWSETQTTEPALYARAETIGRNVVAEMRARYETPLHSLLATAKARGLSPKALAEQLHVGQPIVAKLQQRLLRVASLPGELIEALADALGVSGEQVRAYLYQPATLAAGASYKSDTVPQVADQEDFADAIRACTDMTDAQKSRWLRSDH